MKESPSCVRGVLYEDWVGKPFPRVVCCGLSSCTGVKNLILSYNLIRNLLIKLLHVEELI